MKIISQSPLRFAFIQTLSDLSFFVHQTISNTISNFLNIKNKRKTVDLVRQIESAGASYLTIHPRTRFERHEPIHMDALELLATSCTSDMPIVANGDMFKYSDCLKMKEKVSKIRGVMCARGLLENPALCAGYETTPINCIRDWVDICLRDGTPFTYFHQILIYMLQNVLRKSERRCFNTLLTTASVLDFLNENIFDLF